MHNRNMVIVNGVLTTIDMTVNPNG